MFEPTNAFTMKGDEVKEDTRPRHLSVVISAIMTWVRSCSPLCTQSGECPMRRDRVTMSLTCNHCKESRVQYGAMSAKQSGLHCIQNNTTSNRTHILSRGDHNIPYVTGKYNHSKNMIYYGLTNNIEKHCFNLLGCGKDCDCGWGYAQTAR